MTIGENIKRYREAQHMTQKQLAEKIGVNQSYVAQIERGSKVLTIPICQAMAKELDCTITDLITTTSDTA